MAVKTRINISMDPKTLRLADRLARRRKSSRSEILRRGVESLAAAELRDSEEAAMRDQRRKAISGIREIARKMGDWPAERILHDWRYRLKKDAK
jgi:metal-responsive CopG/Arc/MetJ family transcriptional regulator